MVSDLAADGGVLVVQSSARALLRSQRPVLQVVLEDVALDCTTSTPPSAARSLTIGPPHDAEAPSTPPNLGRLRGTLQGVGEVRGPARVDQLEQRPTRHSHAGAGPDPAHPRSRLSPRTAGSTDTRAIG